MESLTNTPTDAKSFVKGQGEQTTQRAGQGIPSKPSLKRLTIKQRKFVKAYVRLDGNGTRAALEAYGTTDYATANAIARETLQKPSIQDAIEQALQKQNITLDSAIEPIKDGLTATRFGDDDLPDHNVRLKASGMALKLLGADTTEGGGNNFNFNFGTQTFVGKEKGQQG